MGSESKNNIQNKIKEFQQPYLYRLKSANDEDEEYRYRILSNLLFTPYNDKDPEYLYFFGIFPCELIPSAYIPLNYKNHSKNFYRLSKNDKFVEAHYKEIYNQIKKSSGNVDFSFNDKKIIKEELKNMLTKFESHDSLYNFNYLPMTINILILWTIVIFMIMYISLYYYAQIFNYILAITVTVLLVLSIIWKMIYTLQN
jgi:hypothetical protein